jgi:hypothetical protein
MVTILKGTSKTWIADLAAIVAGLTRFQVPHAQKIVFQTICEIRLFLVDLTKLAH